MKMTNASYQAFSDSLTVSLARVDPTKLESFKTTYTISNTSLWNIIHNSEYQGHPVTNYLYTAGLNDSHIETAARKYFIDRGFNLQARAK